jgi:hypothetical protein
MLKQISIFLENKPGKLAEITKVLSDEGINIRALSMADTAEFGILRLIVPYVDKAYKILKEADYTVSITEVIGIKVPDEPGGLYNIITTLSDNDINVEYMYAFVSKCGENALIIFKVENIDKTIKLMQERDVALVEGQEIYSI